jgi:hypothetical protein
LAKRAPETRLTQGFEQGVERAVKKMQKKAKWRLTVWRGEAYIPLTNEGGAAAGGKLLRPSGHHREPRLRPSFRFEALQWKAGDSASFAVGSLTSE